MMGGMKKAPRQSPPGIAYAALSVQLGGQGIGAGELQILPAGEFRSWDGRPADVPHWYIDGDIAQVVIAELRARGTRLVIDYEHQTLKAAENGQPAPAAGWVNAADLEWRDGIGLVARKVEWTARAAAMLDEKEYRYFSPVFPYDKTTGAVLALRMGALTNFPGLDGMADVALKQLLTPTDPQETSVNETLKKLLAALGLSADTTEEAALSAVAAIKSKADTADAAQTAANAQIAALKASPAQPDPAKYVPIETMQAMQTELAALRGDFNANKVTGIVEQALAEGKLLPAQKQWAEDLGKKDLAALTGYLDSAAPIAALAGTQTKGKAPEGEQAAGKLTDAQVAVCKAMGISQDDYRKTLEAN